LKKEAPEVVCLQEVHELSLRYFAKKLEMNYVFGQMGQLAGKKSGLGILCLLPLNDIRRLYYHHDREAASRYILKTGKAPSFPRLVLAARVKSRNAHYLVATTHFTWSALGKATKAQRKDIENLLKVLSDINEFVLCGDFNAPRGGEIFKKIAAQYKDNIPKKYCTSIDANFHRAAERVRAGNLMVDGLFTTPQYECQNVRLVDGVSDHMAIVAEVVKIKPQLY
jgi:endonuclease/exonuclease/phosphatase family metal-dependent hydrolase